MPAVAEANGHAQPVSVAATIEFEGKTYTIPEVPAEELIEAVWAHLRERLDPIEALSARFDQLKDKPELREALVERAFREITKSGPASITKEEAQGFLDSPDGIVWVVAWMLRKGHPEVTEALARRIVIRERLETIQKIRDQAAKRMIEAAKLNAESVGVT